MFRQNIKKIGLMIITGICITCAYFYNSHMYEKEMLDQYNYLLTNNKKLSGIYIQQRQPFPTLSYVHWLLPYHQSLKFIDTDGTVRHVGLGEKPNKTSLFDLTSEFISHLTDEFREIDRGTKSIPIECWVDYKSYLDIFPKTSTLRF
jgi:hypothetical protein